MQVKIKENRVVTIVKLGLQIFIKKLQGFKEVNKINFMKVEIKDR